MTPQYAAVLAVCISFADIFAIRDCAYILNVRHAHLYALLHFSPAVMTAAVNLRELASITKARFNIEVLSIQVYIFLFTELLSLFSHCRLKGCMISQTLISFALSC